MWGRIGKIDFFAVLPAGTYVFIVVIMVAAGGVPSEGEAASIWTSLRPIASGLNGNLAASALVLFFAYLAGSMLRVMPVRWAERMIPPFTSDFPFPDKMKSFVDELKSYSSTVRQESERFPEVGKAVSERILNHWKNYLCITSTPAFEYYQTFEARTRFFAGMLWAGAAGTLVGLLLCLFPSGSSRTPGAQLFAISLVIVLTFGSQFRLVRRRESLALLSLVTTCFQREHQGQAETSTTKSTQATSVSTLRLTRGKPGTA